MDAKSKMSREEKNRRRAMLLSSRLYGSPEYIRICETCPYEKCERGTCTRLRKEADKIVDKWLEGGDSE